MFAMSKEALNRAIEACGSQEALAQKIGVSQQLISYWVKRAKAGVPAEFVLAIEKATGIARSELRPDIYPAPADAEHAA